MIRDRFVDVPKMSIELHPCCIVGGGMVVCWRLRYMICGTEARVEDSSDTAPRLTLPLPTSVEAIKVSLSKKLFHQSDIERVGCCCVTISQVFPPSVCTAAAGVFFN